MLCVFCCRIPPPTTSFHLKLLVTAQTVRQAAWGYVPFLGIRLKHDAEDCVRNRCKGRCPHWSYKELARTSTSCSELEFNSLISRSTIHSFHFLWGFDRTSLVGYLCCHPYLEVYTVRRSLCVLLFCRHHVRIPGYATCRPYASYFPLDVIMECT